MDRFSFLNTISTDYIESLYHQYLQSPDSVEPSWKAFLQGFDFGLENYSQNGAGEYTELPEELEKEFKVINLINGYRTRGHLFTQTNPVRARRQYTPSLALENYGLKENDLDETFKAGEILGIGGPTSLRNIIQHLQQIYCDSIGVEYMYIRKPEEVQWIQNWINANLNHPQLKTEEKVKILHKLNEAVAFENFLHTKFVGQKRFSLEGNETLIPALDELISRSAEHGVQEVVMGMAHRGRLNVLANIFNKSYAQIFNEFEGKEYSESIFSGDVKYHLGANENLTTDTGKEVKINLAPNPSHLEAVDGVAEGISRAKADIAYQNEYSKILPLLIHGDAAIAGQGVVYEVAQMMLLEGYKTGGTIHIVNNNQIGFTTNYLDGRSSTYCTDIAKVTLSPVLHVNADDAEAVIQAIRFAADYRAQWNKDVYIDLLGYRKYGHNEGDEPMFTQPQLYKTIKTHPNPREIYFQRLEQEDIVSKKDLESMQKEYKSLLESDFDASKNEEKTDLVEFLPEEWKDYKIPAKGKVFEKVDTSFPLEKLKTLGKDISQLPEDKKFIRKISRLINARNEMIFEKDALDWGTAETLAYATLLTENHPIRLSGEDVERGTFSHRHAVIKTENDEEEVVLLNRLSLPQKKFEIYNSLLSEYGVMAFDYGYAMAAPDSLTIWEAQFGDFANGAQIIIDQYLSSAEDKWKLQNGLVLLLPHGYEGQGAEHSSARIERFLQLCADENMFMLNCSTPANFYHALRRQMKFNFRKPMVVFTPKSLLRHPECVSSMEELANGSFQTVIDDEIDKKQVKRLVLCSGKFYYDLVAERKENDRKDIAIVRLEQLYPLDVESLEKVIASYPDAELIWAQEEPENMGAWSFLLRSLRPKDLNVIAPSAKSAPSTGSHQTFAKEHKQLIKRVFT